MVGLWLGKKVVTNNTKHLNKKGLVTIPVHRLSKRFD